MLSEFSSSILLILSASSRILLGTVSVYWVGWIFYATNFHPLAKFPGPFLAKISRLWMVLQIVGTKMEKRQRKLHEQLGPIVRVAPNELSISDPEAMKIIYNVDGSFTKTDFYELWAAPYGTSPDSFSDPNETSHAKRMKIMKGVYSMSNIIQAEGGVNDCIDVFISKMQGIARRGEVIDMSRWSQWYAFDVLGQLFFGRMFGFMSEAKDYRGYIRATELNLPVRICASTMPSYMRSVFLGSGFLIPRIYDSVQSYLMLDKEGQICVEERKSSLEAGEIPKQKDLLVFLLDLMERRREKGDFQLSDVQVESRSALFAGSESTATAILTTLYNILDSPSVYKRIMSEIDNAANSGLLSMPHIRYTEAVKLKYLDACIKESMRLYPPVALQLPRNVPKGGCHLLGHWLPEGTRVGVNAAVVHYDKRIFGKDSELFNPDRWFERDSVEMERYMFQFGGGTRTCIGKNITLCEMYKLIPRLLQSFQIELVQPDEELKTFNYWFLKTSNVRMRLRQRSK
ncbi:cytochrome P450 [Corynespora cassiicola Philippines]|uniref:Cytochrome P450 n=1 Tax=Corynespora cassiicola Philippines TaxID=1448308 RepID=A0A2T2NA68_CORCC|nr:cytochrome P450 [Corynespora cassiicola Philippines]